MASPLPVIGDLKGHAVEYARQGLEIFPVDAATKQPMAAHVRGAPSQYGATADPEVVAGWWDRWPDALIGHRLPEDQCVIDIDPRHGGDKTWKLLREELGLPYPDTRLHVSGREDGGGHAWFLRPAGKLTISRLDDWAEERGVGHKIDNADRWVCGLDLLHRMHRYTILPPSPHPVTGLPYRWHKWCDVAPMPEPLAELLIDNSPPPPPHVPKPYSGDSIADWYSATHGVAEILYPHGWHLRSSGSGDADGAKWQHPMATSPVSATVRHGCLFVYSPNTPFEVTAPGDAHGYTPFRVFTVLEHNGDASAAAKAARELKGPEARPVTTGDDFWPPPPISTEQPPPLVDGETGEVIEMDPDERKPTSWLPIDLKDALAGVDVPAPQFWLRSDGKPLVYAGRTHWFQGPSESLKSMAAQMVVVEVVADGGDVLYIDFEDDDRGVVARLLAMGASEEAIAAHVVYVRPDEALMDRGGKWTPGGLDYLATLAMRPWAVCVLDGVTEAMTTEGMEILDNADTARWMRLLPKRIADTGAAVVVIDHTTKNAETAGRHAIGAQHKLAGVTGATYKFEPVRPLARAESEEITGQVKITITKDRPGWVRGQCRDGVVGMFEVTSYPDGGLSPQMMAPGAESSVVDMELIGDILTYLHTYDGASQRRIEEAVDARSARVRGALQAAHGRGWITVKKVGAGHQHSLTDDGRKVME